MENHRIHHNSPLHWGYSGPPQHAIHNTWVPPPSRGLKRSISESDCDDNYSETSSKETSPKETSTDSCQHLSRKKRRGVIEKKRRDRINFSLSELKRLVPSACEKQGSSKLEKAEILQLTVDHLKSLHSKGLDSLSYDPQRFALDYHVIGFRECASEVARYLINHEGMDIQDPLRMRLMSHLQCFVAQREISLKAPNSVVSPNWSTPAHHHTPYHPIPHPVSPLPPPPPPAPLHPTIALPPSSTTSSTAQPISSSLFSHSGYSTSSHINQNNYSYIPNLPPTVHSSNAIFSDSITSRNVTSTIQSNDSMLPAPSQQGLHQQHQPTHYSQHEDQNGSTYTDLSNNTLRNTSGSICYGNPQYPPSGAQGFISTDANDDVSSTGTYNLNKPYRPWGSGPEIAY